jgi:carotenoid cleavage dioxygenase
MNITRRRFGELAGVLAAGAGLGMPWHAGLKAAEIDWISDNPHLKGNFAPIGTELSRYSLPVVAGRIPVDLSGVYMRNGPNPLFRPISYAYPMDGDGMIHAVYLDNGIARYRNRFVQTGSLAVEKRAGRAVYGGLTNPIPVDPALVRRGENPGPFKNGAFISVLRHGDHLLALGEAALAYEMTMELDTIGPWKAGGDVPIRLGAHNRRHPRTGALFTLSYDVDTPMVWFTEIDASGKGVGSVGLELNAPTMVHDFVLTERHLVLLAGPAVFDMEAARAGKSLIQWRPNLGMRIGVRRLDGSSTFWLEADPFFVYHFANGFERAGQIVIDHVRHDRFSLGPMPGPQTPPRLHRLTIDLANRKISDTQVVDLRVEFPRCNDRLEALPTRFVYLPTLAGSLRQQNPPSDTFNTMLKVNTETGDVTRHDFGNKIAGEAVFVPRGTRGEDDGYLALFTFDPASGTSDFVLLDAARIDAAPVAVVRLPQRVPQGLHGTWIAKG